MGQRFSRGVVIGVILGVVLVLGLMTVRTQARQRRYADCVPVVTEKNARDVINHLLDGGKTDFMVVGTGLCGW